VCHNDLFPENVVFRDGLPFALIDFDMAAPGRPLWDVAIAIQVWAPLTADGGRRDHPDSLDGIERFGRFARTYGIEPAGATELVEVVFEERAQALGNIRGHLAAGHPVWTENWPTIGGDERAALDDAWLETRRDALIAAVVDP